MVVVSATAIPDVNGIDFFVTTGTSQSGGKQRNEPACKPPAANRPKPEGKAEQEDSRLQVNYLENGTQDRHRKKYSK